ncbi:MAG: hypothetical protein ACXW2U_05390 [Telluria sp.]
MRLSADPAHPDYKADMLPCKVYLDGVEVRDCLHADEEAGQMVCASRNESGEIYVIGDEIATEVRKGAVRIEPPALLAGGTKELA